MNAETESQRLDLPSLDAFIRKTLDRGNPFGSNSWVTEAGFDALYVRIGTRFVNSERLWPVLDLANIAADNPGGGAFTALCARLRKEWPQLHLFVESVLNDRFASYLERTGFVKLNPNIYGRSFFLPSAVGVNI